MNQSETVGFEQESSLGGSQAEISIELLLQALQNLPKSLQSREEDLRFLRNVFRSHEVVSLFKAHEVVSKTTERSERPVLLDAAGLARTVSYDLESHQLAEAQELFDLLSDPFVHAIMIAHDHVGKEKVLPKEVEIASPVDGGSDGPCVQMVQVKKDKDTALGATVTSDENGTITIARVLDGGLASRNGLFQPGDIIHEINGRSVTGLTIDEIAHIMASSQDKCQPCPEAGLRFECGDILCIVNRDDPLWWQAKHEGGKDTRAGIVPSKLMKERQEAMTSSMSKHTLTLRRRLQLKKPSIYYNITDDKLTHSQVLSYEEMVWYHPDPKHPRPLVLIAPPSIPFEVAELSRRLVGSYPDRFMQAIPHTCKQPGPNEEDGRDYHFVTREQLERDIINGTMIEGGVHQGTLYGLSADTIRSAMDQGKICIVVLNSPQALYHVRTPQLKPCCVYLKPPSGEFMRKHWVPQGLVTETDMTNIFQEARAIQTRYSQLFEHSVEFRTVDLVVAELVEVANSMENTQWIPASWNS
ncbi:hypothetical protein EMCRGX_G018735 [Ephydatia muelleri]